MSEKDAKSTKGRANNVPSKQSRVVLGSMKLDEFKKAVYTRAKVTAGVYDKDSNVLAEAMANEVDIDKIIGSKFKKSPRLSLASGVTTTISALKNAIVDMNSESAEVILAGSYDRCETKSGKHPPMNVVGLARNGENMVFSTFDTSIIVDDNSVELSYPALTKLLYTEETREGGYRSLKIRKAENLKLIEDKDKIIASLEKIAITPDQIDAEQHEDAIVVVKGIVSRIMPSPYIFYSSDGDGDGQWIRDGNYEVLEETGMSSDIVNPAIQINLRGVESPFGDIVYIRGSMTKTYRAKYYVDFPDLEVLLESAVETSSVPTQQAEVVSDALKGNEVYLIGYIGKSKIRPEVTDKGDEVTYVDITLAGVVSTDVIYDQDMNVVTDFSEQSELNIGDDEAPAEEIKESETPTRAKRARKPVKESAPVKSRPKPAVDDDDEPPVDAASPSEEVEEPKAAAPRSPEDESCAIAIIGYQEITGVDVTTLTPDELQKVIKKGEYPLPIVKRAYKIALEKLSANSEGSD